MNQSPTVSIIIPCRNEKKYIGMCLDSIIANDYPKERLEILVVDGMSADKTREIVQLYMKQYGFIRLLDNVKKVTPAALNIGIRNTKGEIIMRMDAHNIYPSGYISGLVKWLRESGADNVGGVCITVPANDTPKANAIAIGLSHPFGVGNSHFRIGGGSKPLWVDTVPFGCYKRAVFERVGLFDEELVRNQDDEFNLRLIKSGGRVLLVPDIISYYFPRESLVKLWRMYYQYGFFKPAVARKVGSVLTFRQIVPSILVLALLVTSLAAPWLPIMAKLLVGIVLAYSLADVIFSITAGFKRGIRCALYLFVVFPTIHFSYGLGYLTGMVRLFIAKGRKKVEVTNRTPITR